MQKFAPVHVVSLFLITLLLSTGCANHDVVKKDEGFTPAPVVRQTDPPKTDQGASSETSSTPIDIREVTPSTASDTSQQNQQTSANEKLQSALNKIYFNFDSAGLSESARSTLAKNAETLASKPIAKIRIEGNCDERGSAEYNLALGERRAKAAQQYLVTMGVNSDRLTTVSYGKEKPSAGGNDEAAWASNRRAEFIIATP
ncbi:MAG: peptidoglycan-associated lipoprotein Pal [Desulfuromonadaceae bacterium]|nr:peptidoglycan-associated lipoprotein Pal [Desulfuromonadaceae bacterium]MDD5107008.1 peptidoglycan-associated lipoprotein Pal [Desulfuromonadaceae bacterium]